ncbi:MAG: serine/threonine protein kinase [Lachnospiraceae bacterium]|jgi:hypothetical protein|nr:serine/threonine protein kinase [Lachnospiraceae bacterium]
MRKVVLSKRYELIREIGRGGCGHVYLAYDRHLRHQVAIKQITGMNTEGGTILWHETNVLKRLEHHTLPKVYDFLTDESGQYMVIEYVRGITLADYIKEKGVMSYSEALVLLNKLIEAVIYLHSFIPPIVHSDLKPENIIIMGDGQIKLIDFGTAFIRYDKSVRSYIAGTPGFSAPELMKSRGIAEETADIYSLGAIFYFILGGKRGTRKNVRKFRKDGVITCREIPRGIIKIIRRAMMNDKDKRYQSIHELANALRDFRFREKRQIIGQIIRQMVRLVTLLVLFLAGVMMLNKGFLDVSPLFAGTKQIWQLGGDEALSDMAGFILQLSGLCLILASLYFFMISGKKRRQNIKSIKSIHLTAKKAQGLWTILLFVAALFAMAMVKNELHAQAAEWDSTQIENEAIELPVFIREHHGVKVLVQDGSVYYPERDIIIEIPLDQLPRSKDMTLRVMVECHEESLSSREFIIHVKEGNFTE